MSRFGDGLDHTLLSLVLDKNFVGPNFHCFVSTVVFGCPTLPVRSSVFGELVFADPTCIEVPRR